MATPIGLIREIFVQPKVQKKIKKQNGFIGQNKIRQFVIKNDLQGLERKIKETPRNFYIQVLANTIFKLYLLNNKIPPPSEALNFACILEKTILGIITNHNDIRRLLLVDEINKYKTHNAEMDTLSIKIDYLSKNHLGRWFHLVNNNYFWNKTTSASNITFAGALGSLSSVVILIFS